VRRSKDRRISSLDEEKRPCIRCWSLRTDLCFLTFGDEAFESRGGQLPRFLLRRTAMVRIVYINATYSNPGLELGIPCSWAERPNHALDHESPAVPACLKVVLSPIFRLVTWWYSLANQCLSFCSCLQILPGVDEKSRFILCVNLGVYLFNWRSALNPIESFQEIDLIVVGGQWLYKLPTRMNGNDDEHHSHGLTLWQIKVCMAPFILLCKHPYCLFVYINHYFKSVIRTIFHTVVRYQDRYMYPSVSWPCRFPPLTWLICDCWHYKVLFVRGVFRDFCQCFNRGDTLWA
jgi:hypothetical protein